jgi:CheY-like chemotaxis protein
LMGGRIGLESAVGVGTTFWFTIPLEHVNCSSDMQISHDAVSAIPLHIVEGHPTTTRILRTLATGWRVPVRPIANFQSLRESLGTMPESGMILVLVDGCTVTKSENGNALEAIQQLRSKYPRHDLRFGLLTSLHNRPSARDLHRAEIHVCLTKPVRRNQFHSALLQLIKQTRQLSAPKEVGHTEQSAKAKATRILLAEDNIVNQRVAVKQLARLGYSADVVSSGVQVLEAVARNRYDVILMDCQMPELDGYEAARRIRQLPSSVGHIHIIAMTANAMHGDREKCIEAGMNDYVSKPVKIEDLRTALERRTIAPTLSPVV